MTTILFEGPAHTYLPEIPAYIRYINEAYPDVKPYVSTDIKDYNANDFDIVWRFMGTDFRGDGRYVVHEYNSLSAGRAPRFKNFVKQTLNAKPDRRVFLNKIVKKGFMFADAVPYIYRDMGIAAQFFELKRQPEYDFVYAGSVNRGPEVMEFIDYFAANMSDATILIVGSVNRDILKRYSNHKNIYFAGRVHYEEVAGYIAKGRYGLNLIPDHYPYNLQTATKVLEYCALGMPIVSMKYRWATQFEKKKNGQFFWLDDGFKNLSLSALKAFDFQTPDLGNRRWKTIIGRSGVFDFLKTG